MEPRAFTRTRFRVVLADNSDCDHWAGGKPYHAGARCPNCKIPLLLLWDINCKDPRFPRNKFGKLKRLPLYFCWGCVSEIAYQVVQEDQIEIHSSIQNEGLSFPYDPYPEFFQRRGLQFFTGIPDEIQRIYHELIARWRTADDDGPVPRPSVADRKKLAQFFGHPVVLPRCFFHHQLGGKPIVDNWAHEVFLCPNPGCEGTVLDRMLSRKRAMKFLAGVLNDPWAGLPLVDEADEDTRKHWNYHVTVQYHICDCCFTVLACNRCN
ncbi:MAG: hypothetical protein R3B84_14950 [Zavarzinella sp.]